MPSTAKLQDMFAIVQQQRDQAINALVVVQAENAALRRESARLAAEQAKPVADPESSTDSPGCTVDEG